ncbi:MULTISPECIES: O-antigen polymerase [Exiguobacterium]|uniref:O-antigen polymerase n=1 Tax=Exiguobacterium TaxID=33986 RepID=UPI001BECFB8A|nr:MULTISPECIES: O-antigen polymerase [Exiguobacterium]MCT4791823.1 oligosaccharide repeat unit polymerase [Exiguobacterium artemiae]
MRLYINSIIEKIIISIIFVILILQNSYSENNNLFMFAILLNAFLIWKYKNSKIIQLLLIFMISYLLYLSPYFISDNQIAFYTAYQTNEYFYKALLIHSVFIFFIYLFTSDKIHKKYKSISDRIEVKNNILIYYFSIFIMFVITLVGKKGESIFSNGGYRTVNDTQSYAVNEYFLIFVLSSYLYSGKNKKKISFIFFICLIYSLKNFMYGSRIEVLQLLILLFIVFFEKYISSKLMWISVSLGFIFMKIIEKFRVNLSLENILNFKNYRIDGSEYIGSNQGDVFYNSAVYVGLIENNIFDNSFRIDAFFQFVKRIFMPSSTVDLSGKLSYFSQQITPSGGGGLISTYFYVWFSFVGVIIISIYLAFLFRSSYISNNQSTLIYITFAFSTIPRWFAYDPITLFKLCLYAVIVMYMCKFVDDKMRNKERKGKYNESNFSLNDNVQ